MLRWRVSYPPPLQVDLKAHGDSVPTPPPPTPHPRLYSEQFLNCGNKSRLFLLSAGLGGDGDLLVCQTPEGRPVEPPRPQFNRVLVLNEAHAKIQ